MSQFKISLVLISILVLGLLMIDFDPMLNSGLAIEREECVQLIIRKQSYFKDVHSHYGASFELIDFKYPISYLEGGNAHFSYEMIADSIGYNIEVRCLIPEWKDSLWQYHFE